MKEEEGEVSTTQPNSSEIADDSKSNFVNEEVDLDKLKQSSSNFLTVLLDAQHLVSTLHALIDTVGKHEKTIKEVADKSKQQDEFQSEVQNWMSNLVKEKEVEKEIREEKHQELLKAKEEAFIRASSDIHIIYQKDREGLLRLEADVADLIQENRQIKLKMKELETKLEEKEKELEMKQSKSLETSERVLRKLKREREASVVNIEELKKKTNEIIINTTNTFDEQITSVRDEYKRDIQMSLMNLEEIIDKKLETIREFQTATSDRVDKQRNDLEEQKEKSLLFENNIKSKFETEKEKNTKNFKAIERDIIKTNILTNCLYDVLQLDRTIVTDIPDCYVTEKFLTKDELAENPLKRHRTDMPRSELNKLWTEKLLVTPAFLRVKETFSLLFDAFVTSNQTVFSEYKRYVSEEFKGIKDKLNDFVTFKEMKVALADFDGHKLLEKQYEHLERNIQYIFSNYLNRDEIWEALRQKADEKNLDTKADRKMIVGLFDYLNEKLNKILGDSSTEDLMDAIRKLEQQLELKADRQELVDSIPTTKPPPNQNIINIFKNQNFDVFEAPLLQSKGDLEGNSFSGQTRCLSCNRPVTAPSKQKRNGSPTKSPTSVRFDIDEETPKLKSTSPPESFNPVFKYTFKDSDKTLEEEMKEMEKENTTNKQTLTLDLRKVEKSIEIRPQPPRSAPSRGFSRPMSAKQKEEPTKRDDGSAMVIRAIINRTKGSETARLPRIKKEF
ncbi:hypothetical protein ABK040_009331 [Willaertia magna]